MTHVAAYFDGRGGRKQHPGTVWDCPKRRCMEWTALWRHGLHAAIERLDRPAPEDRLPLTLGEWNTNKDGLTLSGYSVCGTCDGGGCRDCIG
jgi:hypothetical protein